MKVGWKRQKAFDEYGVSGMKFLIIKLLKNTCITRRIYRLFVCFFFFIVIYNYNFPNDDNENNNKM